MKSCSRILSGAIALLALVSPGCGGGGGAGPDRSPPRVLATIPPAGASGVAVDLAIAVVFDEELWPTSVDGTKFTQTDEQGAAVAGSVS